MATQVRDITLISEEELLSLNSSRSEDIVELLKSQGIIQLTEIRVIMDDIKGLAIDNDVKDAVLQRIKVSTEAQNRSLNNDEALCFPKDTIADDFFYSQKLKEFTLKFYKQQFQLNEPEEETKEEEIAKDAVYQFDLKNELSYRHSQLTSQKEPKKKQAQKPAQSFQHILYYREGSKRKLANFLVYRPTGNERQSFKCLIAFRISSIFQEELNEVRQNIMGQIKNEKNQFLMQTFRTFLRNYQQFRYLKHQPLQKDPQNIQDTLDFISEYQKTYLSSKYPKIHYLPNSSKKSRIITYWQDASVKLAQLLEKSPIQQKFIEETIQKSLNRTGLYFTPGLLKQQNAYSGEDGIMINMNHFQHMTIKEFRMGTLKSYLFLCIVHELAHVLLRSSLTSMRWDDLNESLDVKGEKDRVGAQLLRIAINKSTYIRQMYEKLSCSKLNRQSQRQKIQKKGSQIYNFLDAHSHVIDTINANMRQFHSIRMQLQSVQSILSKIYHVYQQYDKNKWRVLFEEISINPYKQISITKLKNKNSTVFYDFVMAILYSDNYFRFLGLFKLDAYKKFVANKLTRGQLNQVYETLEQKFEEILDEILSTEIKESCKEEIPVFNDFFFLDEPIESIDRQIKSFLAHFKYGQVDNYLTQFYEDFNIFHVKSNIIQIFLSSQVSLNEANLKKIQKIHQINETSKNLMLYLKNFQVLLISTQLSDLIFRKRPPRYDSGFYLQDLIFPNLTKYLYAQDYDLMKVLTLQTASKVGLLPLESVQKFHRIKINNISSLKRLKKKELKRRGCREIIRVRPREDDGDWTDESDQPDLEQMKKDQARYLMLKKLEAKQKDALRPKQPNFGRGRR